jgi:hypothetical protein
MLAIACLLDRRSRAVPSWMLVQDHCVEPLGLWLGRAQRRAHAPWPPSKAAMLAFKLESPQFAMIRAPTGCLTTADLLGRELRNFSVLHRRIRLSGVCELFIFKFLDRDSDRARFC